MRKRIKIYEFWNNLFLYSTNALWVKNKEGKTPKDLANELGYKELLKCF